jgi:hypothetical protein
MDLQDISIVDLMTVPTNVVESSGDAGLLPPESRDRIRNSAQSVLEVLKRSEAEKAGGQSG